MKNVIKSIFVVAIFLNCTDSKHSLTDDSEDKREYLKAIGFFGNSLTNHFPNYELIENIHITQSCDTFAYHNTLDFYIIIPEANKIIDSVLNTKLSANVYAANDSCLLVVNDYIDNTNLGDRFIAAKSTFIENCSDNKLPVPNFWNSEYSNETRCKLSKDFTLYVLESKIGAYSKKIKQEQSSMPDTMRHGYSKGFAISKEKNTIIYWVVIW